MELAQVIPGHTRVKMMIKMNTYVIRGNNISLPAKSIARAFERLRIIQRIMLSHRAHIIKKLSEGQQRHQPIENQKLPKRKCNRRADNCGIETKLANSQRKRYLVVQFGLFLM